MHKYLTHLLAAHTAQHPHEMTWQQHLAAAGPAGVAVVVAVTVIAIYVVIKVIAAFTH